MYGFHDVLRLMADHDGTGRAGCVEELSPYFRDRRYRLCEAREAFAIPGGGSLPGKVVVPAGQDLPLGNVTLHARPGGAEDLFVFLAVPSGRIAFYVNGESHVFVNATDRHVNLECRLKRRSSLAVIHPETTCNGARLINDNSLFSLGRDAMVSDEVIFQCSDQHGVVDVRDMAVANNRFSRIDIGEHCWIGRRALIAKNVTLGNGGIVASGAVVTKSFGGFCAVGGNPAEVIREGCTWSRDPECVSDGERRRIERLLETER